MFAGWTGTTYPHSLPVLGESQQLGISLELRREAGIPSIKELLLQEFVPHGYRYQSTVSGHGNYEMVKQGSQNYCLGISVDASPIAGQFHPSFIVETPFARFVVAIKLQPDRADYPINESLADVVKNTAFAAQVLEETFVREIESLFGVAPQWFAAIETAR